MERSKTFKINQISLIFLFLIFVVTAIILVATSIENKLTRTPGTRLDSLHSTRTELIRRESWLWEQIADTTLYYPEQIRQFKLEQKQVTNKIDSIQILISYERYK